MLHHLFINTVNHFEYRCYNTGVVLKELNSLEKGFNQPKRCDLTVQKYMYKVLNITKTYIYNFDPLKIHFYIVKLGFTGVNIIFLISVLSRNMNIYDLFLI